MHDSSSPLVYILNGPNLNLLGTREPEMYGTVTLSEIATRCQEHATKGGLRVEFRQSNHEGVLIDWVQEARDHAAGIIMNPAGLTSTSISLFDALKAVALPVIEVHITNIHQREAFRHFSYISQAADAVIAGAGPHGYQMAIDQMGRLVRS